MVWCLLLPLAPCVILSQIRDISYKSLTPGQKYFDLKKYSRQNSCPGEIQMVKLGVQG